MVCPLKIVVKCQQRLLPTELSGKEFSGSLPLAVCAKSIAQRDTPQGWLVALRDEVGKHTRARPMEWAEM
jgi:hypothetical protein